MHTSTLKVFVALIVFIACAQTARATTVVTAAGTIDPPSGFFSSIPTRVDFDASAADRGIPAGVLLETGIVGSPDNPGNFQPQFWDYAQNSPSSNVWAPGSPGIIFSFTGSSVTQVGLVYTDGPPSTNVTLAAYDGLDGSGTLLGSVSAVRGDDTFNLSFGEDCFFGIKDVGSIRSIVLSTGNADQGLEADVLQFTPAVPEPTTFSILALTSSALLLRRRRSVCGY